MKLTNNLKPISIALKTGIILFMITTGLFSKDILDVLGGNQRRLDRTFMPMLDQEYVFHTNGQLWMGWDSYGNTGDQTCSAIIPGWVYPGSFSTGGHGYLNYNCRAGYWIVGTIGGEYVEGTTGEYVLTRGTEPGSSPTQGWAGSDSDYNKEPWVSSTTWVIPTAGLEIQATRRSWSFPGSTNYYFKVGEHDYNDFVLEEILISNTGSDTVEDLVFGAKADHDCTWNVPYPDWDYPFWTDDVVDYDEVSMATMELDGDDQGSATNDFGIDDPNREYRGVRVAQAPLNINGKNHDALESTDLTHMWWTGDEDPQTAAARHSMASLGFTGGDKKDVNPSPMDMRYLQAYGPFTLAPGETATISTTVLAASGLENIRQATANAKQAYDWGYNLPKPPAAPQIASDGVTTTADATAAITWSYSTAQIEAVDPDKGAADFAGFRVYRSSPAPKVTSAALFSDEGVSADSEGSVSAGSAFSANAEGPYGLIKDMSSAEMSNYSNGDGTYTYEDVNVAIGMNYWYYVAAYDAGGSDPVHGDVPSLESYYTMCYPLQEYPAESGNMIPNAPSMFTVAPEVLSYEDLDGKAVQDIFPIPNPWRATIMEEFHGASSPAAYFVRFYNVKAGDVVKIFDVTGNLVYESDAIAENGSWDWNLISRTRNQVVTGVYYWTVDDQSGKLAVIR